jgi:DNA-binding CsgD family transcriptional regulator
MLTPRQTDVIGLLARGLTTRQTATLLGMSDQTVRWHSKHARRRLNARNTAHAVAISLHHRLIVP